MLILGLAGAAGVGKDEVAKYLEQRYGFQIFAFSDSLYREVTEAFDLESEDLLRGRGTKEEPTELLALKNCRDEDYIKVACGIIASENPDTFFDLGQVLLSPRFVLQTWGTEYRRAQDPDYWVKKTAEWLAAVPKLFTYPEQVPTLFVNTTVRFPNERQWIHDMGGNVWHIHRRAAKPVALHVSENPLEIWLGEREIYNNDSIERLHYGIDLLMTTAARFVAVEPELPKESEYEPTIKDGLPKEFEYEITTKNDLLWRNGKVIGLPEADNVAKARGYTCAEDFVRALKKAK